MGDYNEGSRRRDRHRRHKNQAGRGNSANGGNTGNTGNQRDGSPAREERRESPKIDLPPLPKLPTPPCAKCGEPIQDISTALADKGGGGPVHFDCVLAFLQGAENLGANEKIVYIGQGRFAVVFFENPVDTRKFRIVRLIEWEPREGKAEWRAEIADRYSHVK